jgi:hypothetical protein
MPTPTNLASEKPFFNTHACFQQLFVQGCFPPDLAALFSNDATLAFYYLARGGLAMGSGG